jgi:cell division protein ZapB
MPEKLLAKVEMRLDELILRYRRLEEEHQKLRMKEHAWINERARLEEKQEIARARIESMITRLKQIETDTQ